MLKGKLMKEKIVKIWWYLFMRLGVIGVSMISSISALFIEFKIIQPSGRFNNDYDFCLIRGIWLAIVIMIPLGIIYDKIYKKFDCWNRP